MHILEWLPSSLVGVSDKHIHDEQTHLDHQGIMDRLEVSVSSHELTSEVIGMKLINRLDHGAAATHFVSDSCTLNTRTGLQSRLPNVLKM